MQGSGRHLLIPIGQERHGTGHQVRPLVVRWPGIADEGRVDGALHYHFDWAATMIELFGGQVADNWDGRSFADAFREGREAGREYLVTSQMAWACQRGVRFEDYICLHTYHDGYKMLKPVMLFNLADDPHEQIDMADERPDLVARAMAFLVNWYQEMVAAALHDVDPMMTVLREGGSFHTRGRLPAYLERLRATGRAHHAETLAARHPDEV